MNKVGESPSYVLIELGITQLFFDNETAWPHRKGAASAPETRRKVGVELASIHLPAFRHSPPHYDCPWVYIEKVNHKLKKLQIVENISAHIQR